MIARLEAGAKRAARAARRALSATVVDRILNVDTAESVELAGLGLDHPDRVDYEAGGWRDLRRVLPPSEVAPDDVFIDLGAGKGRMLLAASRYPFRRVIGVELSDRLAAIARSNVAAFRPRARSGPVELVTADVTAYRIPGDVTVVYMFNPFRGSIFDAVVAELVASVDRSPRVVRLILRNGASHDRLIRSGRFALVRSSLGLRPGRGWREATAVRLYELA